jgi:hypothetical protein
MITLKVDIKAGEKLGHNVGGDVYVMDDGTVVDKSFFTDFDIPTEPASGTFEMDDEIYNMAVDTQKKIDLLNSVSQDFPLEGDENE